MSKKVLITGATGGLGRALASAFDGAGYQLCLVDIDRERLEEMSAAFPNSSRHVLNQLDPNEVSRFCDEVIAAHHFDVAVINAGMIIVGDVVAIKRDALLNQLQVNLVSGAVLIQALGQRMRERRSGHILATVSMGGIISLKGSATYSASKFGLRGLLWGLSEELSAHGVKVTGIYPSGIDTPMLRHEAMHGGSNLNFVSKPTTVEEVAKATLDAVHRPRLEVYVPKGDSLSSRLLAFWPGLLSHLYPLLERIGESGRKRYLRNFDAAPQDGAIRH